MLPLENSGPKRRVLGSARLMDLAQSNSFSGGIQGSVSLQQTPIAWWALFFAVTTDGAA
jgi:hypothetical protein